MHFTFTVNDLTGNSSTYLGSNTVAQLVDFDRTIPTLTSVLISSNNEFDPSLATVGDQITVNFTASEIIQDPPTITIGGTSATVSGSGTNWSAARALTSDDTEGNIPFAIDFLDLASNQGVQCN